MSNNISRDSDESQDRRPSDQSPIIRSSQKYNRESLGNSNSANNLTPNTNRSSQRVKHDLIPTATYPKYI